MREYPFIVPKADEIDELWRDLKDTWAERNTFIKAVREMLIGENTIEAPANTQYKVRTMHTYTLASIFNEKVARYSHIPKLQVVPEYSEDLTEARKESSQLERALEIAQYEMERHGDGDVWSHVIMDAVTLDEGVEKIERAPAAFWPELVKYQRDKTQFTHMFQDSETLQTDSDRVADYKKIKGLPLRSVYVPLERYYPVLEGSVPVEVIEVETRTLRSIKRNKLFDQEAVATIGGSATSSSIKEKVTLLHYSNQKIYATFALGQSTNTFGATQPETEGYANGTPVLLHAYEHNLGRVIYNSVAGRFGGWKSSANKVEGVGKALVDLNQKSDEIVSQVLTNVRARYWPTLVHEVDPDRRGFQAGSPPRAINVPEGQNITIFKGESIAPIFKTEHDEAVPWLMDQLQAMMSALAGGGTLFGGRSPGVETGYHQNLQITQAEHLDEKVEQHIAWGAVQRGTIMLKHIKIMGDVYVNHIDVDRVGNSSNKYTKISKSKLSPMPRLSAQVRKPRPIDFAAAGRSARDMTDDRGGKGPLFSDDTAREEILGITAPDAEKRKVLVESQQRKLMETGIIDVEVAKKVALLMAAESAPQVGPQDAAGADPALTQAVGGAGSMNRGQPAGQSQPEAAAGKEIANAQAAPIAGTA